MKNKIIIWCDIDPNDPETILGAYMHNFALIGAIIVPIIAIILTCIYLHPFVLFGFFPCSILVGLLMGALVGSIAGRIIMKRVRE
ncbi:hypothetical protein ACFL38_00950 [Candidatus Omnitrophota bacterium]